MSSLPITPHIEILDLRHFSARQMRSLLEREAGVWQQKLRWDYHQSTELLLGYLDSRILQGYVALEEGRIRGYAFAVYEGHKAVIGDAFAVSASSAPDPAATRILLERMLETLQNTPGVDRVESQLLLFDAGEFGDLFRGPEYAIHPRLFLERELPGPVQTSTGSVPTELELVPWSSSDYQAAGELIHACYQGHSDAGINDQYRTLHGSLRFLHNIVRFPGCGTFEPQFSWLLRDRSTRSLAGMVLCSRVMRDAAHVTQLCVLPAFRGRGLGRALLEKASDTLLHDGFRAVTLTVTEANTEAMKLYRSLGFRPRHRFDAMVWTTRNSRS